MGSIVKMDMLVQKMDKITKLVNSSGESVENAAILIWILRYVGQCLSSLAA